MIHRCAKRGEQIRGQLFEENGLHGKVKETGKRRKEQREGEREKREETSKHDVGTKHCRLQMS